MSHAIVVQNKVAFIELVTGDEHAQKLYTEFGLAPEKKEVPLKLTVPSFLVRVILSKVPADMQESMKTMLDGSTTEFSAYFGNYDDKARESVKHLSNINEVEVGDMKLYVRTKFPLPEGAMDKTVQGLRVLNKNPADAFESAKATFEQTAESTQAKPDNVESIKPDAKAEAPKADAKAAEPGDKDGVVKTTVIDLTAGACSQVFDHAVNKEGVKSTSGTKTESGQTVAPAMAAMAAALCPSKKTAEAPASA